MAPEVLQKGAMAMPADVYSFAMLMLELWTGEIVYSGINSHQVINSEPPRCMILFIGGICLCKLSTPMHSISIIRHMRY